MDASDEPTDCSDSVAAAVPGGVLTRERLWTMRTNGAVCSVGKGEGAPRPEAHPEQALALCGREGSVSVLTSTGVETGDTWTLRRLEGGLWRGDMTFDAQSDRFVALACAPGRVTVLTSKRALTVSGDDTTSVTLSAEVPAGLTAVYLGEDRAYVGLDKGELKDRLLRVDLRDGAVTSAVTGEL